MKNSDFWTPITNLCGSHTSPVVLCMQYSVISTRITCLWVPTLICGVCIQNSAFWTRITNLYGSQISPVILCMQYRVFSTRITCLYGSQPLSVVFGFKTATFWAELQVSMSPRHDLSFCGCKTACLASEKLVSMGPSPHVWFLDSKQRLLDQNNKSPRVPDITCRFVHGK